MGHDFLIGEGVFLFSVSLEEIIYGTIEGFEGKQRERVKVLQRVQDGFIRHIVSWVYVSRERIGAEEIYEEYLLQKKDEENLHPLGMPSTIYYAGMTVNLKQSGELVCDKEGNPYNYQIIKVFRNRQRASLVNAHGEPVGTFSYGELVFISTEPLFHSSNYQIGERVSWIEGDDVYEGTITQTKGLTAEVSNIKKLLPWDYKKVLPYYKLHGDALDESDNLVLTSIIGDDIDRE